MSIGVAMIVIGVMVAGAGIPKTDRRFKTGYKGNAEPNGSVIGFGALIALLGLLVVGVAKLVEGDPEPVVQRARGDRKIERDMSEPPPPDMARPRRKRKRVPSKKDPYEFIPDRPSGPALPPELDVDD